MDNCSPNIDLYTWYLHCNETGSRSRIIEDKLFSWQISGYQSIQRAATYFFVVFYKNDLKIFYWIINKYLLSYCCRTVIYKSSYNQYTWQIWYDVLSLTSLNQVCEIQARLKKLLFSFIFLYFINLSQIRSCKSYINVCFVNNLICYLGM